MKKLLVIGLGIVLLGLPQIAMATHHKVFISKIIKLSNTSCAVELQICSNGQNAFDSGDNIKIGATANTFGAAAAAINTGGHVNSGDHILAASDVFNSGVPAPDFMIAEANCAALATSPVVSYFIAAGSDDCSGGSPCLINQIDTSAVTGYTGADDSAMTRAASGCPSTATPQFFDLSTPCSLTVSNNAAGTALVGSGATCSSGGGTATAGGSATAGSATAGGGGGGSCGDHSCGSGETAANCPADCGSCGDGICGGTENSTSCPADCVGVGGAICGDGTCQSSETAATCPGDCGSCGDGICGGTEDSSSCAADCGSSSSTGSSSGGSAKSGGCSLIR